MKKILIPILLALAISVVHASSDSNQTQTTVVAPPLPTTRSSLLNMTILSVSINGCFQTTNINSTWTGSQVYPISTGSFNLIIKARNAVYSNSTDVLFPNNSISTFYLFRNIPITLSLTFNSCTPIGQESLIYLDGTYTFILS